MPKIVPLSVEDASRAHSPLPQNDGKVLLPLKLYEDMTVKLFFSTGSCVLFLSFVSQKVPVEGDLKYNKAIYDPEIYTFISRSF